MKKILASFPFLFLLACGSDSPGSGPISAADAEDACTLGCQHDEECGNLDVDETVDQCITECVDTATGLVRGDAFTALAECTAALECTASDDACNDTVNPLAVHEEWEARCREVMPACIPDAAQLDAYCETDPNAAGDNNGFLSLFAAPLIEDLTACFDETGCDAISACQQAVFEQYGISA